MLQEGLFWVWVVVSVQKREAKLRKWYGYITSVWTGTLYERDETQGEAASCAKWTFRAQMAGTQLCRKGSLQEQYIRGTSLSKHHYKSAIDLVVWPKKYSNPTSHKT